MERSGANFSNVRPRTRPSHGGQGDLSIEHYARVIFHRKWIVIVVFLLGTIGTFIFTSRLPDVYSSETVILVDPQKVPDTYVRSTVTGDVRNRLGTLSQQILSVTRLQKIIDSLNLYPEERKIMAREDIITRMRKDISVSIVSDFGANQELQAFRISYSGKQPRLVAQVTNELASLFIEENLKAREQQATGTTEFLNNQLQETRKALEGQEGKLRDFKLKHIGEMPEQQSASLQILGQLQSQLQLESEALSRAEQQKNYLQSMMATQTNAPVVDMDNSDTVKISSKAVDKRSPSQNQVSSTRAKLAALLTRYSDEHPDVRRLKRQIEDEDAKQAKERNEPAPGSESQPTEPADFVVASSQPKRPSQQPRMISNPVLTSQLGVAEAEIAKHREEQQRISKSLSRYQARLEAIPVREQQITELVRDYEIAKGHYKQLLEKQMSAETATQLEIRQKGERFSVLDPAQPAERPSRPQRSLINAAGSITGLALGLLLALVTELLGMSITTPEQIVAVSGYPVLEVIPVIYTHADRVSQKRRLVLSMASAGVILLASCVFLIYQHRDRFF